MVMSYWEKVELRFGSEVNFQASKNGELHDTNKLLVAAFLFFFLRQKSGQQTAVIKYRDPGDRISFGGTIGWKVKEKLEENRRS